MDWLTIYEDETDKWSPHNFSQAQQEGAGKVMAFTGNALVVLDNRARIGIDIPVSRLALVKIALGCCLAVLKYDGIGASWFRHTKRPQHRREAKEWTKLDNQEREQQLNVVRTILQKNE